MRIHASEVELLAGNWRATFESLLDSAQGEILVCSPFVGAEPLETMTAVLTHRNNVSSSIVTDLSADRITSAATDVRALAELCATARNLSVPHLPKLHAKVYVVDGRQAVITSANLTQAGMQWNHEYGIVLRNPQIVRCVRDDVLRFQHLGVTIRPESLQRLASFCCGREIPVGISLPQP